MKKILVFVVLLFTCLSVFALEPMGSFRSTFGNMESLNEFVLNEIKTDLNRNRLSTLDMFLDSLESLDNPSAFQPAIKSVEELLQYRIVHRKDRIGLASRLARLRAIESRSQAIPAPKPIVFPRDGGKHTNKLMEWWYFNGHLYDEAGNEYGFEFCFFRASPFVHFVHVAITDVKGERFFFQRRMISPFKAKISDEKMSLKFDDWEVNYLGNQYFHLKANNKDISLNLKVKSTRKHLLFNQSGYVKMSKDGHSFYYSLTSMETSGAIRVKDRSFKVKGETWFDHQWGNFVISCVWGWDWFCIKLDDGTRYNVFGFHDQKGKLYNPVVSCMLPDNTQKTTYRLKLKPLDYWTSPWTKRRYPSGYEVTLPEWDTVLRVAPKLKDQELPANSMTIDFIDYWEGTCSVEGKVAGKSVTGKAYNEICGYPEVK